LIEVERADFVSVPVTNLQRAAAFYGEIVFALHRYAPTS